MTRLCRPTSRKPHARRCDNSDMAQGPWNEDGPAASAWERSGSSSEARTIRRETSPVNASAQLLEERGVVGHQAVAAERQQTAHEPQIVDRPEDHHKTKPAREPDAARPGQADVRMDREQTYTPVHGAESTERARNEEPEPDALHGGAGLPEGPGREGGDDQEVVEPRARHRPRHRARHGIRGGRRSARGPSAGRRVLDLDVHAAAAPRVFEGFLQSRDPLAAKAG